MDGLMVDSEPLWFDVERDFARSRGGEWTEELAARCRGQGLPKTLRVLHETYGLPVDMERDMGEIIGRFIAGVPKLALKRGCRELVDEASGKLPIAVASSSAKRLVEAVLARFDLGPRFDAIVTGEQVTRPKPAPDIFLAAAARLGVEAQACVVLEDSLAGVKAGRAAGMRVIAVPEFGDAGFREVADAVVGDLVEARALLSL
jgi:beta-phosphoglucomutase-like phosphatase (HAD superfamily)